VKPETSCLNGAFKDMPTSEILHRKTTVRKLNLQVFAHRYAQVSMNSSARRKFGNSCASNCELTACGA